MGGGAQWYSFWTKVRVLLLKEFDQSGDLEVNVLPQDRGSLYFVLFSFQQRSHSFILYDEQQRRLMHGF